MYKVVSVMTVSLLCSGLAKADPLCNVVSKSAQGDPSEIHCAVHVAKPQHLRFKTDFAGSHDDTAISIAPSLNGTPIACDATSKIESKFEEGNGGEVSLNCGFELGAARDVQIVKIALSIHHAQYVAHHLLFD